MGAAVFGTSLHSGRVGCVTHFCLRSVTALQSGRDGSAVHLSCNSLQPGCDLSFAHWSCRDSHSGRVPFIAQNFRSSSTLALGLMPQVASCGTCPHLVRLSTS